MGCGQNENKEKILVEGIIITDMNIRSTPELNGDENLLYEESVPGTMVEILNLIQLLLKKVTFGVKSKLKELLL